MRYLKELTAYLNKQLLLDEGEEMEEAVEVLQIKLPKTLAEWLKEFSKELAMDPSQLLANILTYYFEAYRKGFERCYLQSNSEREEKGVKHLPLLAEKFIEEERLKGKKSKTNFIVKKFASWVKDKLLDISELNDSTINAFLQEYIKERELSEYTITLYRATLRKFIEFVFKTIRSS